MSAHGSRYPGRGRAASAFTLIEILVVVAIIALLLAVLLPSLARARVQAKVAVCKANSKQVGTMMASYQAEYRGAVPVVYNVHSWAVGPSGPSAANHATDPPARTCWLPIALRYYSSSKSAARMHRIPDKSGGTYDPNIWWTGSKFADFEAELMDEVWTCPFNWGRGPGFVSTGRTVRIEGPSGADDYNLNEFRGTHNSYHTWKWDGNVVRREVPYSAYGANVYPGDPYPPSQPAPQSVDGRPEYSVLSWHWGRPNNPSFTPHPSFFSLNDASADLDNRHRIWSISEAHRVKAASLSDVTVVYCAQGEHMGLKSRDGGTINNLGSHRGSQGGGTDVIFADSHVGWAKGRRVGWE